MYEQIINYIWLYSVLFFAYFHSELTSKDLTINEGQIVDASFVEAPRQRNTPSENKMIKEGKGDELFNENSHKKRQKDIDVRWTKKNRETFYGYKMHSKIDGKSKFIKKYLVTSAEVHNSVPVADLLDQSDESQAFSADSADISEEINAALEKT